MINFNPANTTTTSGGSSGSYYDAVFGGIKDVFSQYIGYRDNKDARRYASEAGLYSAGPVTDGFSEPIDYQKWGLMIGAAGLVIAVLAFVLRK